MNYLDRDLPMHYPCPQYIQLYPTIRCNLRCYFCFNAPTTETIKHDLTFNNAVRLIDILSANSIPQMDIMGGEPMLLDWMPDFVRSAAGRDISVNISTNGCNPAVIRNFSGIDPSKVTVGISLEGSTAERHNGITGSSSFVAAVESIKTLVSMKMDPVVKTVVNRRTMTDIQNIADLVRSIGVKRYFLIHMDLISKDDVLLKEAMGYTEFLAFYRKSKEDNPGIGIYPVNASCFDKDSLPAGARCAGGVRKFAVMPDGSVFPCNLFQELKNFKLGNIFIDDLPAIWTSPALDFFRRFERNGCDAETCSNRDSCTGGCPAHAFYHAGHPEGRDIRCG